MTPLTPQQKALRINLDRSVYGTLAEIGAGQEVARWFFQAGGAARTVAKTISAYDMAVSDAIYGESERYVSRQRVSGMMAYEYNLLVERLSAKRGDQTAFFAYADTVATRSYSRSIDNSSADGNGWLGIRFQATPHAEPSDIIIHIITRDKERVREQEAIGILGVNLIHGAAFLRREPVELLISLMDNLTRDRVEMDMVQFSGPAFAEVDNRLMSLQLVEHGFTDAAMFTAKGRVVQPAEALYKKPILVERGRFRPITLLTLDLLERSREQFFAEPELEGEEPVVLMEMTLRGLRSEGGLLSEEGVDQKEFLARADTLRALGLSVLISNHGPYYQLVENLSRYTQKNIGIALGIPALGHVLDEKHYHGLSGGGLEAIGRLFKQHVRMYLYPYLDPNTNQLVTAETLEVAPRWRHLYAFLRENRYVEPVRNCTRKYLSIDGDEVLRQIQAGEPAWENAVPPEIAGIIKQERLFGWKEH
ncbi:MAG: TonB-dependent receptor [Acidobacteriia bacterium]|nr:TonB-dependent receptor [Terriglobia bacterium]